ncbi:DNA repair protein RAD51 homolog 4-like [Haliotis cracherodii]|uniref:DNA repair protein RAD51 homolog 4-like n=1 Tax=Haliotis cracherodii TaxID=6455 RepID=UPI0039E93865
MTALIPGVCSALTQAVVESLKKTGVKTVTDFITDDVESLAQRCSIPYKDLVAIKRVLLAQHSSYPVLGHEAYSSACSTLAFFSTGCERLDSILDGGLYTGEVTEVAGEIAAGKTQICLSSAACVSCQQRVAYVDTCGAFSAERVMEMLQLQGHTQNPEEVMSRICCFQPHDIFTLFAVLENIRVQLVKQTDSFYRCLKLLVVDSVTSVIYPVLGGQQMDGHGLMVQLGHTLKMLAVEFSIAVLISNNVVFGADGQRVASLGRTWSHIPHTRLVIEKTGRSQHRRAVVVKSSRLVTPVSTSFTIPSLEPDS